MAFTIFNDSRAKWKTKCYWQSDTCKWFLIPLVLWAKKGKKEVLTYKKSDICLIRIKEETEI